MSEQRQDEHEAHSAAEHARQDQAAQIDHDRLDKIGNWFRRRWLIPVAVVFLVAWSAFNSSTSTSNTTKLNQQSVTLSILQAEVQQLVNFDQLQTQTNASQTKAAQQQATIFNAFFTKFLAEQDYLCRIASARAVIGGLEAPPPGICNVTLGPSPATP